MDVQNTAACKLDWFSNSTCSICD